MYLLSSKRLHGYLYKFKFIYTYIYIYIYLKDLFFTRHCNSSIRSTFVNSNKAFIKHWQSKFIAYFHNTYYSASVQDFIWNNCSFVPSFKGFSHITFLLVFDMMENYCNCNINIVKTFYKVWWRIIRIRN